MNKLAYIRGYMEKVAVELSDIDTFYNEPIQQINLDQLKKHEGFRDSPYKDSKGFTTIGYGFNLMAPDTKADIDKYYGAGFADKFTSGKAKMDETIASKYIRDRYYNTHNKLFGKGNVGIPGVVSMYYNSPSLVGPKMRGYMSEYAKGNKEILIDMAGHMALDGWKPEPTSPGLARRRLLEARSAAQFAFRNRDPRAVRALQFIHNLLTTKWNPNTREEQLQMLKQYNDYVNPKPIVPPTPAPQPTVTPSSSKPVYPPFP